MNIVLWIIFGALTGWVASIIAGTNARQGALMNIIVGVLGAFVGGWLVQQLGGAGVTGFNLGSLLVAILGAVVLLFVYRLISRAS